MGKLRANSEIISDKSKNPVTTSTYIKHGNQWLDDAVNNAIGAAASKADKTYVDSELTKKANKSDTDAALSSKADKSALEATNASVSANTSNIQGLSTESTVLSARMDEFTKLKEGSTTGDAELIDGRVSADGKTYDNIGGAIRGQVTDLKSDLVNLSDVVGVEEVQYTPINGYYISEKGFLTQTSGYAITEPILFEKGKKYNIPNTGGKYITVLKKVIMTMWDSSNLKQYMLGDSIIVGSESDSEKIVIKEYIPDNDFYGTVTYNLSTPITITSEELVGDYIADIRETDIFKKGTMDFRPFNSGYISGSNGKAGAYPSRVYTPNYYHILPNKTIRTTNGFKMMVVKYWNDIGKTFVSRTDFVDEYTPTDDFSLFRFVLGYFENDVEQSTALTNEQIELASKSLIMDSLELNIERKPKEKIWCVVGDSLTQKSNRAEIAYYDYVSKDLNLKVINKGSSGTGYKRPEPFYARIANMTEEFDILTIFGSFNDINIEMDYQYGTASDTTTDTLGGCINTAIDNFYNKYPTGKIGLITPTPWAEYYNGSLIDSTRMENYVSLILEIGKRRGIPVLDLYHTSGLRPWNSSVIAEYYTENDVADSGVHPSSKGHKFFYPLVREFVKGLLAID